MSWQHFDAATGPGARSVGCIGGVTTPLLENELLAKCLKCLTANAGKKSSEFHG